MQDTADDNIVSLLLVMSVAATQLASRHAIGRFGRLHRASEAMRNVDAMIERVAPTPATVFVVGESGSGKEVVARTIHDLS